MAARIVRIILKRGGGTFFPNLNNHKPNHFSVDRYVCPFCWVIPTLVYTSWLHNPGELRLHVPGSEPVFHKTLPAHYEYRWQDFWRHKLPQVSRERWNKDEEFYRTTQQHKKYPVAAEGQPSANEWERAALHEWSNLNRSRRNFYNRAGNQIPK